METFQVITLVTTNSLVVAQSSDDFGLVKNFDLKEWKRSVRWACT